MEKDLYRNLLGVALNHPGWSKETEINSAILSGLGDEECDDVYVVSLKSPEKISFLLDNNVSFSRRILHLVKGGFSFSRGSFNELPTEEKKDILKSVGKIISKDPSILCEPYDDPSGSNSFGHFSRNEKIKWSSFEHLMSFKNFTFINAVLKKYSKDKNLFIHARNFLPNVTAQHKEWFHHIDDRVYKKYKSLFKTYTEIGMFKDENYLSSVINEVPHYLVLGLFEVLAQNKPIMNELSIKGVNLSDLLLKKMTAYGSDDYLKNDLSGSGLSDIITLLYEFKHNGFIPPEERMNFFKQKYTNMANAKQISVFSDGVIKIEEFVLNCKISDQTKDVAIKKVKI